jgi:hypothetical protein
VKTLIKPELLIEMPETSPVESPAPHGLFRKGSPKSEARSGDRRSA